MRRSKPPFSFSPREASESSPVGILTSEALEKLSIVSLPGRISRSNTPRVCRTQRSLFRISTGKQFPIQSLERQTMSCCSYDIGRDFQRHCPRSPEPRICSGIYAIRGNMRRSSRDRYVCFPSFIPASDCCSHHLST